jgi:hypothetical protein
MMKSATMPHQRTLRKSTQTQCLQVEVLNQFRITGKQDLKPAIQSKAIYLVGANPPTWPVFCLQQLHGQPRTLQTHGTTETRQSCPHDCYIGHGRQFATSGDSILDHMKLHASAHNLIDACDCISNII